MVKKSDERKILRVVSKTSKKFIVDKGYLPFAQSSATTRGHYSFNAGKAGYSESSEKHLVPYLTGLLSEIDRFRRRGSCSDAAESLKEIYYGLGDSKAKTQLTSGERYKIAEAAVDRGYRIVDAIDEVIKRDSEKKRQWASDGIKQEKQKVLKTIKNIESIVGEIQLRKHRLTRATVTTAIAGLLVGLFFLSSNITGNAISNLNQTSSNWIGVVCLAVGLIAGFFYFKGR